MFDDLITPHRYVIQQRVEHARQLLRKSDQPILGVALECGFASHIHLSRMFYNAKGITPEEFRTQTP